MADRARCLVLGLDGLPLDLARTLGKNLPNIGRLALSADSSAIRAELPELSPVNWTSFFTAADPGEHGVYGFVRINPASYELGIADFSHVQTPTIFDRLGEKGLASRVVNLPNTYPARPINGMLISGFVAEKLEKAVFPPFLASQLKAVDYLLEADTNRGAEDPDYLLSQLRHTLRSRLAALDLLWPDLDWDLFVLVFTETDRLFHFLLPAVTNEKHRLHAPCMELMGQWDRAIGKVLDRFDALPEPKRLISLADHGFTELVIEADLNRWLEELGLLHFTAPPEHLLDATRISSSTSAFALDPGRIYLHSKDRFSRGKLDDSKTLAMRTRLRESLLNLTWNGRRVIEEVHVGSELYSGPQVFAAPDLVCVPGKGFDLKAKFGQKEVFSMQGRFGTHTADGAFFYDSHGSRPDRVRNVGIEILDYFGIIK